MAVPKRLVARVGFEKPENQNELGYHPEILSQFFTGYIGDNESTYPRKVLTNHIIYSEPPELRPNDPRAQAAYKYTYDKLLTYEDPYAGRGFTPQEEALLHKYFFRDYVVDPIVEHRTEAYKKNVMVMPHVGFGLDYAGNNMGQYFAGFIDKIWKLRIPNPPEQLPPPFKIIMPFSAGAHAMNMLVEFNSEGKYKITVTNPYSDGYFNGPAMDAFNAINNKLAAIGYKPSEVPLVLHDGGRIQTIAGPCGIINVELAGRIINASADKPNEFIDFKQLQKDIPILNTVLGTLQNQLIQAAYTRVAPKGVPAKPVAPSAAYVETGGIQNFTIDVPAGASAFVVNFSTDAERVIEAKRTEKMDILENSIKLAVGDYLGDQGIDPAYIAVTKEAGKITIALTVDPGVLTVEELQVIGQLQPIIEQSLQDWGFNKNVSATSRVIDIPEPSTAGGDPEHIEKRAPPSKRPAGWWKSTKKSKLADEGESAVLRSMGSEKSPANTTGISAVEKACNDIAKNVSNVQLVKSATEFTFNKTGETSSFMTVFTPDKGNTIGEIAVSDPTDPVAKQSLEILQRAIPTKYMVDNCGSIDYAKALLDLYGKDKLVFNETDPKIATYIAQLQRDPKYGPMVVTKAEHHKNLTM